MMLFFFILLLIVHFFSPFMITFPKDIFSQTAALSSSPAKGLYYNPVAAGFRLKISMGIKIQIPTTLEHIMADEQSWLYLSVY